MQLTQGEKTADNDKDEEYIEADGKDTYIIIQYFCEILRVQSVV